MFDETNCVFYNWKFSVVSLVSDRLLGGHDGKCDATRFCQARRHFSVAL